VAVLIDRIMLEPQWRLRVEEIEELSILKDLAACAFGSFNSNIGDRRVYFKTFYEKFNASMLISRFESGRYHTRYHEQNLLDARHAIHPPIAFSNELCGELGDQFRVFDLQAGNFMGALKYVEQATSTRERNIFRNGMSRSLEKLVKCGITICLFIEIQGEALNNDAVNCIDDEILLNGVLTEREEYSVAQRRWYPYLFQAWFYEDTGL
jgi:hypothetical protein